MRNGEANRYCVPGFCISLWPEIRFDRWLFKTLVAQGKFDQTLSLLDTLEMRSDYSESERNARIEAIKALKSKSSQDMQSASRTLETLSLSDSSNGTTVIQLLIMLGDIDAATAATVRYVKSEKTNFPELYSSKFAPLRHRPEIVQIFDQLGLIRYWKETRVKPDFCKTDSVAQLCNL